MERRDSHTPDDPLTGQIIAACIEVHRFLGPGLLESAYEQCLCCELSARNIDFVRHKAVPVAYKGVLVDCGYCMDIVVAGTVVVELKSVRCLERVHLAQVLTYLRLGGYPTGLLVNFNVTALRLGIRRLTRSPSVEPRCRFPDRI